MKQGIWSKQKEDKIRAGFPAGLSPEGWGGKCSLGQSQQHPGASASTPGWLTRLGKGRWGKWSQPGRNLHLEDWGGDLPKVGQKMNQPFSTLLHISKMPFLPHFPRCLHEKMVTQMMCLEGVCLGNPVCLSMEIKCLLFVMPYTHAFLGLKAQSGNNITKCHRVWGNSSLLPYPLTPSVISLTKALIITNLLRSIINVVVPFCIIVAFMKKGSKYLYSFY